MAAYLAIRIKDRALNYNAVVAKWPQYKADIGTILTSEGYVIDDNGWAYKVEP